MSPLIILTVSVELKTELFLGALAKAIKMAGFLTLQDESTSTPFVEPRPAWFVV